MIRSFAWHDLPILHRYRHQGLFLDSILVVTRGPRIVPGVLFSYLTPVSSFFTSVYTDRESENHALMGQFVHTAGSPSARLSFVAPEEALENPGVPELLDHIAHQAGERGALRLLAQVDERSVMFEILRRAGFAIYARQRIWQLIDGPTSQEIQIHWQSAASQDTLAMQSLYNSLVPGLVQQVEPPPSGHAHSLACWQREELLGYVEIKHGPCGTWAQPFIHPDVENVHARLVDMLHSIPENSVHPIYLCTRSYQSWLEPAIQELRAKPSPLQAVMVKRLAAHQRVARHFALPKLEGQPEISAPIAQSKRNS